VSNGRQAVARAKKLRPAVVLMDVSMPLLNGLQATREILEANPPTPGCKMGFPLDFPNRKAHRFQRWFV